MSNIKRLLELRKAAPSKYMFKAEQYSEIAPAADFYNTVYEELPKLCADLEAAKKDVVEWKRTANARDAVHLKLTADLEAAKVENAEYKKIIDEFNSAMLEADCFYAKSDELAKENKE